MVQKHFVPVALNLQVEAERQDAQGDFFRQINKAPFPEANKIPYFTGASGRIHGMTASGKFLCAHTPGAITSKAKARQNRFVFIARIVTEATRTTARDLRADWQRRAR